MARDKNIIVISFKVLWLLIYHKVIILFPPNLRSNDVDGKGRAGIIQSGEHEQR